MARRDELEVGGERIVVMTTPTQEGYTVAVAVAETEHVVRIDSSDGHRYVVHLDGVRREVSAAVSDDAIFVGDLTLRVATYDPVLGPDATGDGRIRATTDGLVIAIQVAPGDRVSKGENLLVVEAMKMEHRHLADGDGVVTSVNVSEGVQVANGQVLVELELEEVE